MKKKCILFIHGIGSTDEKTWGSVADIIKTRKQERKYKNIEFEYYTYTSEKLSFSSLATNTLLNLFNNTEKNEILFDKISSISKEFKSHIDKYIIPYYENITIIAHSMGGLISTRYLLDEIKAGNSLKINKILYICTPFIGSYFADISKKLLIGSPEALNMTTDSSFLSTLAQDSEKYEFNNKIHYDYFLGTDDGIIVDYRKIIVHDTQFTLPGDHNTILHGSNINKNFKFLEDFFLEKKYKTFLETLYSKAILNDSLKFNNNFSRVITTEEARESIDQNNIQKYLLKGTDKLLFEEMLNLINVHSFNPHRKFIAEEYYSPINSNNILLDNFWDDISTKDNLLPHLYIGPRGGGKTLIQNIWINNHFEEMEERNIFHIRCDIHKIYELMKKSITGTDHINLTIEHYLDMQFLYIFLKYRNNKYNTKSDNYSGVESKLMKKIDNTINKNNEEIVKNYTFENLGTFLDIQSHNIKHNEVNVRKSDDRKYSYAIFMMQTLTHNNTDTLIDNLLDDSQTILTNDLLNEYLAVFNSEEQKNILETLKGIIKEYDKGIYDKRQMDARINLLLTDKYKTGYSHNKSIAELWLKTSKYIQKTILNEGYKILNIIDGIDNIIIQDSPEDKTFFNIKLKELAEIIEPKHQKKSVYYFIALRNDTMTLFLKNYTVRSTAGYGENNITYNKLEHSHSSRNIDIISKKRYSTLINKIKTLDKVSLYQDVLSCLFNSELHTPELENIDNTRMLLRHKLFLSLQVYFEFIRSKKNFNNKDCKKFTKRVLKETLFLRDKLCIATDIQKNSSLEDMYKIFPNIFYPHEETAKWSGLCRIRILQLLQSNNLSLENIITILSVIYDKKYIQKKVDSLLSYNLIKTNLDKEFKTVMYKTSNKGDKLLSLIKSDLDILYYLSLDTPMPEKFTNISSYENSYMAIFRKRSDSDPKNTGYHHSIIKSVSTFILFIKYIHDDETLLLDNHMQSNPFIKEFEIPFNISVIDNKMKEKYKHVKNHDIIKSYFMKVGQYNDTRLNRDLVHFNWE